MRSALRENAAAITLDSLRHRGPVAVRRSKVRSVTVVAAALLVAGVITSAVVFNGGGPDGGQPPGARVEQDPYIGYHWRMRSVTNGDQVHVVPPDVGAAASFFPSGEFTLLDGINTIFGRYEGGAAALDLRDTGRTYAAYDGDDPLRWLVISAVASLESATIRLSVADAELTIRTAAYTMVFDRGDPLTGIPSAPPSR